MVLARKWRPQGFDSLVGQEAVAQTLQNAIASGRIPHGYLFTGTRGVGKTSAARILTKALNCVNGPTPNPCGVCEACVAITQGNYLDVIEIDAASNRSIDDIRELREQVRYAPVQGKYKVYILDEVHMLTKDAFNALLKTLEEPPPHIVFIFATTELRKVPETILSRVQRFDFKRISEAKIRERLRFICQSDNIKADDEALEMIARRGDGSMRDALSCFDQVYAFGSENITVQLVRDLLGVPPWELYENLFKAIYAKQRAACLLQLDVIYTQGFDINEFLQGFGEYIRHLLYAGQKGLSAEMAGFSQNLFARLAEVRSTARDEDLVRYGQIVASLLREIRGAANPRLLLEMGLIRMASLDPALSLQELLEKINQASPTDAALKKK